MAVPSLPVCLTLLLVFLTRVSWSSPPRSSTAIPTVRTVVQQQNTTVGAVPLSLVEQENTTVGAVPLAAESTTITETPPQSTSTSSSFPDNKSTENEFSVSADTRQDGSTTAAETTIADEMTTVESPSTTEQLPPGRIPWAPYTALKEEDKEYLTDDLDPWEHRVWLPEVETAMGRWVSKDMAQAQLLNIQPGFLLPQVEVGNHPEIEKPDVEIKPEFLLHQVEVEGLPDIEGTNIHNRHKRAVGVPNHVVAMCGGTYRDLYGVIQSPSYPLYYPNNKKCLFDIEVPDNYTLKLTCEHFMMQGGENCTHDYMMVDFTGDPNFSNGQKFCGLDPPSIVSNGTRMTIHFVSDDLFRYQGFSCRYRALQPNGNAVIGTFGNITDSVRPAGNNFMQVVQCPSLNSVSTNPGSGSGSVGPTTGASLYSGMWNGQCGSSLPGLPPAPSNRIVGGYPTEEFQFPWIASVLKSCENGNSYCHICGATIISESWILTGAHCMAKVAMEELGVLVGDHNLYTISNSQKFIKVKEKVVHPDYNKRGNLTSPLNNDIGLLRLEYPIVFTSQVSPLCLPALGETGFGGSAYGNGSSSELDTTGLNIVGKNATVLGWGMINDDGVFSDALRGVEVEILDNQECNKLYGIMTETMMCTSGSNGRGTCFGDSGGPAIVMQKDGSYVQVGILSFGALAGCEKGYPSGQVLVHKYIDWIQSITGIAF